jgi:hypothetical protein
MIKLKSLIYETDSNKILVPRRSGPEREKRWIQEIYRKIQDYIKGGCRGALDLHDTPIKILPDNLKRVGGYLGLSLSKVEDLNNLEYVNGHLDLRHTPIKKLPDNLKRIGGSLTLGRSQIEDLNSLEYVNGTLDLKYTPIKKLPDNLDYIGGSLILYNSKIEDLNSLEYVGGHLDITNTPLSSMLLLDEIRSKIHVRGHIFL